jgi:hypothetical protein
MADPTPDAPESKSGVSTLGCLGRVVLILCGGAVFAAAVFFAFLYFQFVRPYVHAEERLRSELHALRFEPGTLKTDHYEGGSCFDNCPVLRRTYRSHDLSPCAALPQAASALRAAHYQVLMNGPTVTGQKENFYVTVYAGGIECQGPNDPRHAPADEVLLDLTYNP